MSAHAPAPAPGSGQQTGFMARHHFLLRRLHSLSGIVPVGMFVIAHLFTNAQMAMDRHGHEFQHETDFIHSLPFLFFIELSLWLGIGFHAALGLVYTYTGKANLGTYRYEGNWRYTLQRITGILALIFIFLHIATLRWRWDLFGWFTPYYGNLGEHHDVPMSMPLTAYALQFSAWVALLYAVGTLSVIYHWANGLWTAAITWGVTLTPASQKRWGYACAGLGVALTVFFGAAMWAARTYDFDVMTPAQRTEFVKLIGEDKALAFLGESDAPAAQPVEAAH